MKFPHRLKPVGAFLSTKKEKFSYNLLKMDEGNDIIL